jgi:hypothetical protein
MRSQHRIVISRGTTYDRLLEQVAEYSGEICLIIGKGARSRRLLDRLHREVPSVIPGESPDGREHVGVLHDGSLTAIAWHRDEPGKPPVFEVNDLRDPQGVFR